jgi:hypothetical protein
MAVIRTPQQQTNFFASQAVREALMTAGEECIVLHLYHVFEDDGTQPRCSCYDNVYEQIADWECPLCYGTTFVGGIKNIWRAWGIFSDHPLSEKYAKPGMWTSDDRSVQLENEPTLMQHDFLVRVQQWDNYGAPVLLGDRFVIDEVKQSSLRTGNRYGQTIMDVYGNSGKIHRVPPNHPIQNYNIALGTPLPRVDGLPR